MLRVGSTITMLLLSTILTPLLHGASTAPTALEAADYGLRIIKSLNFFDDVKNRDEYASDLGFESAGEIANAELGIPFKIKRVGLKQLSNFQDGIDINNLVVESPMLIFPVKVRREVRSSLTVTELQGQWRWTERGSRYLIRKLDAQRQKLEQEGKTDSYVVWIPGLNLRFLGVGTGDQSILVPLSNVRLENVSFNVGVELPARRVFSELSPIAGKAVTQKGFR